MKRTINIWTTLDWLSVLFYLVLITIGWVSIYAATYVPGERNILNFSEQQGKQFLWIAFSLLIAFIIIMIDNKFYFYFSYVLYFFFIFLLILVFLFGKEIHGARSWFQIGGVYIQPTEFAKFATSLALARYLSTFNLKIHKFNTLFVLTAIILLPVGLIILQHDAGSALVYSVFIFVLYREGLSGKFLLLALLIVILFFISIVFSPMVVIIILLIFSFLIFWAIQGKWKNVSIGAGVYVGVFFLFWSISKLLSLQLSIYFILFSALIFCSFYYIALAYRYNIRYIYFIIAILISSIAFSYSVERIVNDVLKEHQKKRIFILLGLDQDLKGAGYSVNQSKIAIGSGGFAGKGFLKGTQTKFNFVPEQSTDFIFCTIGEEWGFIGTFLLITLFVLFLLRIIFLAERQRSSFSRIYGYSVAAILFFHLLINIGMTIGLAPVIGIPLPFISYGGSSLWGFTILLFIFLRLDASRLELL